MQESGLYYTIIDTPLGAMQALAEYKAESGAAEGGACNAGLTRLDFADKLPFSRPAEYAEALDLPLFNVLRAWLATYFAGEDLGAAPPLSARGSAFQEQVWDLLRRIPYGATTSYGALAATVAAKRRIPVMAAQAVGGAVGRNPISIVIPCHRVIGLHGSLTGYGGGLERKRFLLNLEGAL
jgi:methylated-DNA-[protein]-cysteine S-methyltransferase